MHMVPWQLGRMNILIRPYSKIAIPIILFVIGAVCLTELINHVRHHGEEQMMTLFWVEFDTTAPLPWALIIAFLVSGFILSRLFMRELKEAWSNATFAKVALLQASFNSLINNLDRINPDTRNAIIRAQGRGAVVSNSTQNKVIICSSP